MKNPLIGLSAADLRALALAVRTGRLGPPFSATGVQRMLDSAVASGVAASLREFSEAGTPTAGIAATLELLAASIEERPPLEELVDLVTTGPETGGAEYRDTSVVVAELFRKATESVLVAGYAVYQGQHVFHALAGRMQELPSLKVRLFLDVQRKSGDTSMDSEIVRRFAHRFRETQWPGDRPLPEVFFNPRSLASDPAKRSALHAKCVVVDSEEVFVSSANFTEAAQQRNIEIGLLLRSPAIASQVSRFFESLLAKRQFERVL